MTNILDTVEPDAFLAKTIFDTLTISQQGIPGAFPIYSRETVESLLAENRKQVLLGAAEKIDYKSGYPMSDMWRKHCADELRRMVESDKGGDDEHS